MRPAVLFTLITLASASALLAGCPEKKAPPPAPKPDAAVAKVDAAPKPPQPRTFTGSYETTAGTLYIPDASDWKHTRYPADAAAAIGKGPIAITIDPDGRVFGATDGGPLGASVLEGRATDAGAVAATVRRKDASDHGLTGTLTGHVKGLELEATMKLSEASASFVRDAKVTAKTETPARRAPSTR